MAGKQPQSSFRLFEDTLNCLNEGVVVFDKDERLVVFNRAYAKLFEPKEFSLVRELRQANSFRRRYFPGIRISRRRPPITNGLTWSYPIFVPRQVNLVCGGPRMAAFIQSCIREPAMAEQPLPGPTLRSSGGFCKHWRSRKNISGKH